MTGVGLGVAIASAALLVAWLQQRFGDVRRTAWYVSASVFAAWFLSVGIVFILPFDVSATLYRECAVAKGEGNCTAPVGLVEKHTLVGLWAFVYWTSQVLTWIILPVIQSYVLSGHFSFWRRLRYALRENAIIYGAFAGIFGILLMYVAVAEGVDARTLPGLVVATSNTWGLFFLIVLMGVGVVEVPRHFWRRGRPRKQLMALEFAASQLRMQLEDATEELEEVLDDVLAARERAFSSAPGPPGSWSAKRRAYMEKILAECPGGGVGLEETRSGYKERRVRDDDLFDTVSSLAVLNRRVKAAVRNKRRAEVVYQRCVDRALDLEDSFANSTNSTHRFLSSVHRPDTGRFADITRPIEWFWKVKVRAKFFLMIATVATISSFLLVWSEVTFFVSNPVLSLCAVAMRAAADSTKYLAAALFTFFALSFMALCAYSTLFRIRISTYYYLAPHHETDDGSLLYCAMFLSRLTAPLAYNYLLLAHLDGKSPLTTEKTAFTTIMGPMEVAPFIEEGFNVYFPIVMILVAVLTYFHSCSRLLACVGVSAFFDPGNSLSNESIAEGREFIKRERRRRERALTSGVPVTSDIAMDDEPLDSVSGTHGQVDTQERRALARARLRELREQRNGRDGPSARESARALVGSRSNAADEPTSTMALLAAEADEPEDYNPALVRLGGHDSGGPARSGGRPHRNLFG